MDDFLRPSDRGRGHAAKVKAVTVEAGSATYTSPAAVFDNRGDHTSSLRADESALDPEQVSDLRRALTISLSSQT